MWISETLRNQNYGWILFNKNNPNALWWWWLEYDWLWNAKAKTYEDEEYKNMSPIEAAAKSISTMRAQTQQRSNQQVVSDLINSQNTMYWSAMANRDKATSAEEMKAAQLDAFAAIVKWRAIEDWYEKEWGDYNTTKDIMSHYIDLNSSDEVNKRLVQYANSQEDPYDFAMSMWVLLSPEQKRIRSLQNDLDALFWVFWWTSPKRFTNTIDFLWNQMRWWLSSRTNPMEKWDFNEMFANSTSDEAPILWALENYAYRTFWKHINNLDEYEANKLLNDLKDTELLKQYLPNEATAIANKFEWATYGVLSTVLPRTTLSLEWILSIPVVWDVTSWTLKNLARSMWQALTYSVLAPLAGTLSYNLNNEEERLDFYEALWAVFMWWDHENNWWASTRWKWDKKTEWAFRQFLKSDINTILWETKDKVSDVSEKWQSVLWWITNNIKKRSEERQKAKQEKISEDLTSQAGKTVNPKYTYESKQAADTYSQMDMEQLRGIKDFKTLINTIRNMIKWKASAQDAILDTIDRQYWLWTEYREPLAWRWEVSDIPSNTVQKWFDIMDRYTHFTRDKNILNIMKKIAIKNKLTAKDLKQMARWLDMQFKIWKKWKTHEEIKEWEADVEAVRQELNWLIRQEVEWIQDFKDVWIWNILEYLDKQQSPMIATVEKLVELNNKVNQIKAAIPDKSVLNKVWWFLSKFTSKWKALNTVINKMWWEEYMDALLREKNLNRALNSFADLYEKLEKEPDKSEEVLKEWIKDKTNKEVAEEYGWFVEWEVMEPESRPWRSPNEYLEELLWAVEIERPEDFMLWEDTQYNGQSPIDYTTPTRVTEEWYPWRYWATSESYKWKPAWDFWTPREFEPKQTVEDYVWKYWQSLESFKAQLEKAGLKTDLIDAFLENIQKKNFKVWWRQWVLLDDLWEWWIKWNLADIAEEQAKSKSKKSWKNSKKNDK